MEYKSRARDRNNSLVNVNFYTSPPEESSHNMSNHTTGLLTMDELILNYNTSRVYFYTTAVMSILSIIGAMVIIMSYAANVDLRTSGRKLLVYLSFADMFTAVGNLMGILWYIYKHALEDTACVLLCKFHGGLTIFSSISSFFWTVIIALHLYLCIVLNKCKTSDKLTKIFHVICWGLPGIVTSVALACDVIGYDKDLKHPSWCWIDTEKPNLLLWQYFTVKGWEIIAYITTVILYTKLKCFLSDRLYHPPIRRVQGKQPRRTRSAIEESNRRLTFVPIIFICLRIWGTIRFLLGAHFYSYVTARNSAWIVPLQGVGDSAQGFANCIMFITVTKTRRRRLCGDCCLLPCCCYKTKGRRKDSHKVIDAQIEDKTDEERSCLQTREIITEETK